jgi:hypothetical protein
MDWSIILSSCIVAATTIGSLLLKEYLQYKKNRKKACVARYTQQNSNVQKAIRYALDQLDADRVYVYEFHNGESFYSGGHQQKFSCTHETLKAGVSSEALNLQDLRVSTFNDFISPVINDRKFDVPDISKLSDSLLKNWFDNRGIASTFAFPVVTLNKNIIGMIAIDFTKNKDKLKEEEKSFIIQQSKIIGGYLI